jgi:hypothetical protein
MQTLSTMIFKTQYVANLVAVQKKVHQKSLYICALCRSCNESFEVLKMHANTSA